MRALGETAAKRTMAVVFSATSTKDNALYYCTHCTLGTCILQPPTPASKPSDVKTPMMSPCKSIPYIFSPKL